MSIELTDKDRQYIELSAKKIKEYCKEQDPLCKGCKFAFHSNTGLRCVFTQNYPELWEFDDYRGIEK